MHFLHKGGRGGTIGRQGETPGERGEKHTTLQEKPQCVLRVLNQDVRNQFVEGKMKL